MGCMTLLDTDTLLLDPAALATRLGVSARFIRRLVNERRVPYIKVGRFVRFDVNEIDAWLVSHRVDPPVMPRPMRR
jgi:excisionase family DNA binding protein